MNCFELSVRPILEKMGLFNGKEISVKEAFEKYLEVFPNGIGPMGVFMSILNHKFYLDTKEVRDGDNVTDYILFYKPRNNMLDYDPRLQYRR